MATWEAPGLIPANDEASDEIVWTRLRIKRDALLAESDWSVLPDAPTDKSAWQDYRQALRDLPDTTSDPREAAWPVPPTV